MRHTENKLSDKLRGFLLIVSILIKYTDAVFPIYLIKSLLPPPFPLALL